MGKALATRAGSPAPSRGKSMTRSASISPADGRGPDRGFDPTENRSLQSGQCAGHGSRIGIGVEKADFVAGHSLGEYSALGAADAVNVATTARLLKLRGKAAGRRPRREGAMAPCSAWASRRRSRSRRKPRKAKSAPSPTTTTPARSSSPATGRLWSGRSTSPRRMVRSEHCCSRSPLPFIAP